MGKRLVPVVVYSGIQPWDCQKIRETYRSAYDVAIVTPNKPKEINHGTKLISHSPAGWLG